MQRINRLWCALAVLAMLAMISAPPTAVGAPVAPPVPIEPPALQGNAIIVTGQGSVETTPDRATIALGIQVVSPTAQEALERSNQVMNQVVARIMALGVPRERIRTAHVSLYQRRPGEVSGYQANNRITVTVDDLSLVGKIIDTSVAAGANSVDSLMFGLRDPAAARASALRTAVQNAQAAATAIAGAAGIGPLHLVRITEGGPPVPPIRYLGAPAPGVATATPVLPGTLTVTVEVRAVYTF